MMFIFLYDNDLSCVKNGEGRHIINLIFYVNLKIHPFISHIR